MAQRKKTRFFDSTKLLNILDIIPNKLEEQGIDDIYKNQLRDLLVLLQYNKPIISHYNRSLPDRGCPLQVSDSEYYIIQKLP